MARLISYSVLPEDVDLDELRREWLKGYDPLVGDIYRYRSSFAGPRGCLVQIVKINQLGIFIGGGDIGLIAAYDQWIPLLEHKLLVRVRLLMNVLIKEPPTFNSVSLADILKFSNRIMPASWHQKQTT